MQSYRSFLLPVLSLLLIHPVSEVFCQSPQTQVSADAAGAAEAAEEAVVALDAPYWTSFQGFLEDQPADTSYDIQFRLMNQASLGSPLWTETHSGVPVTNGVFNVLLGSATNPLSSVDFDDDLWLSIKLNGGNEILPRARIVGTPYSFLSVEALDLRLPAQISGATGLGEGPLLTITQTGTVGNVLDLDGGGGAEIGVRITGTDFYGVYVFPDEGTGVFGSGQTGVAADATGDAFHAISPGDDGLQVSNAGDDGIHIVTAGDDAIYVQGATDAGIFVDGVGGYAFDFRDVPVTSAGQNLTAYVGRVENTSTGTSADALAIQIETPGNPGVAANFIGFFDGDDQLIGQIEGNGAGGVAYNTSGADYAEYLPHAGEGQAFSPGDVVGVSNGHISHNTEGAHQIMVITDRAAVLGNTPSGLDDAPRHEAVSFVGQVRVRVDGRVEEGDYIVASGRNDGIGVAVSPEAISLEHISSIVGRAWASSEGPGVHRVNIVVGLDRTEVLETVIRRQNDELQSQRETLDRLRRILEVHMREHSGS